MDTNEIREKLKIYKEKALDLKKTISKYITKRELIIIAVVAIGIFLILCDKPCSTDFFFMWKPSFWSMDQIDDASYKIVIPEAGSSDSGIELDSIVITDISHELTDEITTAKEYIIAQIDFQVFNAMDVFVPKNEVREQVEIFETGRLNFGSKYDVYYYIFTPGGEYSGNKILHVAIQKGDKLISAQYRSRWMDFDNNYEEAFEMIKSIRVK